MGEHLKLVLDWVDDILENSDPDNPDSWFCDHPREFAETIAFDERREGIRAAIAALRLTTNGSEVSHG